jgi:hypothetical protein
VNKNWHYQGAIHFKYENYHSYVIQINYTLRMLAVNIHLRGPITRRPPDFGLGTEPELDHISRARKPRGRPRAFLIAAASWTFNLSTITTGTKSSNDRVAKRARVRNENSGLRTLRQAQSAVR